MTAQKPDSPEPLPAAAPVPAARSEALEAELAMLEAILPPNADRVAQTTRVDPATPERGGAQ